MGHLLTEEIIRCDDWPLQVAETMEEICGHNYGANSVQEWEEMMQNKQKLPGRGL